MPGKVNPTQSEAMTMVCVQVIGNDTAIGIAGSQGNFELNVFKPVMISQLPALGRPAHRRLRLVPRVLRRGHRAERASRSPSTCANSLMLVTALNPHIGYDKAAKVAKNAHREQARCARPRSSSATSAGEEFDRYVQADKMLAPEV